MTNIEQENTLQSDAQKEQETDALKACMAETAKLKDALLRATADFENAKRRMEKDRLQWSRIAQTEMLTGLLSVIDDFDRALEQKPKEIPAELAQWFNGFSMIEKKFHTYLQTIGVKEIQATEFNPELHEAIMSVEAPDKESGSLVQIFEKGYTFKDAVLRAAKVSVAK